MASTSALQAQVASDRRALQRSLGEIRGRLSPTAISSEIGANLTSRVSDVGHTLTAQASSPAGLVALCAMAFTTAFASSGGMKRKPDEISATPVQSLPVATTHVTVPVRDALSMLAQLSAAVAVGAVASRFLPVSRVERELLSGVGPDLKNILQRQIEDQAQRLVSPRSDRFGLINLVALGGALFLSRRR